MKRTDNAMDVRLLSWRYKDIRGGLSGLELKLGSPPTRWTLIQMPNGMGKTTTMHLFRAALSGETLEADIVRGFRPSDKVDRGEFEVTLSIGEKLWRITLLLDYEAGTSRYCTAKAAEKSGGKQAGHILPPELKSLLTPAFTRLFVFDGELARQIRDLKRQEAAGAIRTLYQLDRLGAARVQIDQLVQDQQDKASAATKTQTSQGLRQLKTRLATAQAQLSDLKRRQRDLQGELAEKKERHAECEKAIRDQLQQSQEFRSRMNDLDRTRQEVERTLVDADLPIER